MNPAEAIAERIMTVRRSITRVEEELEKLPDNVWLPISKQKFQARQHELYTLARLMGLQKEVGEILRKEKV